MHPRCFGEGGTKMTMLAFGTTLVPWNAQWSGEQRYEIRPCRWAAGRLAIWQPHSPCVGRPVFAKPHSVRQRQSVARFLCTVCGDPTPPKDRWWFGHGEFREGMFMTQEAPVHRICAEIALSKCPHLRGREADLARFPSGHSIAFAILGGTVDADFNVKMAGRTVIGAMKFAWPEGIVQVRSTPTGGAG
jgi:hypothetical protein